MLIRVDLCRTCVDSCWLVSDSYWFVLTRVDLCWYSCIRIDLIAFKHLVTMDWMNIFWTCDIIIVKQVWKCIRKVQMFLQFVCNKNDNKLEITFVRSSLDLGNKIWIGKPFIDIYRHLSLQKPIFASRKLWNYLGQVFLVGFSSFLLSDYTSLPGPLNVRINGFILYSFNDDDTSFALFPF